MSWTEHVARMRHTTNVHKFRSKDLKEGSNWKT